MSESRSSYRYALAIIEYAEEIQQLDAVSRDFESIRSLIGVSRDFQVFLKSPVIRNEKKLEILSILFKDKVSDATFRFLTLLTSKNREGLLHEIIGKFMALRDERLGVIDVAMRSAVPITADQERQLVDQLKRATKKQPRLHKEIDPNLLGGISVRFEDTVWDGSVRRQLELLQRKFAEGHA